MSRMRNFVGATSVAMLCFFQADCMAIEANSLLIQAKGIAAEAAPTGVNQGEAS
ncbi:MAG: hypothetical protein ABI114_05450 [Rhodanobacter sp.]